MAQQIHFPPPKALVVRVKRCAEEFQTLDGVEYPIRVAVTIGPFIIARRKNERPLERIKIFEILHINFILAPRSASFDVSDVDGELGAAIVDGRNKPFVRWRRIYLPVSRKRVVWHVSDGGKVKSSRVLSIAKACQAEP
ncbi:MAG: hypothetical protein JNK48_16005 [Bryobacterales bacterium]|nr:hypothetical protein [Bryobacterales bacterium]